MFSLSKKMGHLLLDTVDTISMPYSSLLGGRFGIQAGPNWDKIQLETNPFVSDEIRSPQYDFGHL